MSTVSESTQILLIEDDVRQADLIRRRLILEMPDARIQVAATGETGFDLARSDPPDVLLLDYDLPDINGLEVYRRMRAGQIEPLVIFITGCGTTEVAIEAMKLGAYDFVIKEEGYMSRLSDAIRAALDADACSRRHPCGIEAEGPLRPLIQEYESRLIVERLERFQWRRAETARSLGITRESLYMKIVRYGIRKEEDEPSS